ncbi:U7 snRNA-associated Sm-like protein LSm10 [Maniola hyperantus]|uniref:U7 snRNA-associated Sm-like protein LSm10 n=1 Tax=Aphantopus hyperantus TaxID=2795564 RepID=UPI001567F57F|nr:U7 snRNA-associated Sm-like protein LSm10 [Maniola hyperantus]
MNFEGTSREKFFYHNTLLCLIRSLQDKNITVDLRNDSYVCGQLVAVDGFMNLSFCKAVYCDTQQNEYFFDNLFIQGRNIRYIHIPETMTILGSLTNELKRNKDKKLSLKPEVKSRKVTKALKQHMKTVAELDN